MSLLTARNLAQSFGAVDLFAGISFAVPDNARIGLVGPNGAGKTTLLRLLTGEAVPASGRVERARDLKLGYLHQEAVDAFADTQGTVWDEMHRVFGSVRADGEQLAQIEHAMAAGDHDPELLARYGELQARFEAAGGYDHEQRIKRVLEGLGLGEETWGLPVAVFSGGQKTRALLAKLLLEQPDLLVLDEPTNHLDVSAVEWLEGFLIGWPGAFLVVSHDRYFLDRVAGTIWELADGILEEYAGNFSAYMAQRAERWARRRKVFDEVKARLARDLDFIRRNMAGQNTNQAQGRLARLAREVEAIHAGGLGVLDQIRSVGWLQATGSLDMLRASDKVNDVGRRIDELRAPSGALPEVSIRLAPSPRGGDIVLRTHDLVVGFPGAPLFRAEDIELRRGACAALIGANGTGKTTLLRTIVGQHDPLEGTIRLGANIVVGYFAQAHEDLAPGNTVLAELQRHHGLETGPARSHLGRFLFTGDDAFKRVADLSGGERGRLALAVLVLKGANFLIMDEPTNHLDIVAQEVLQAVLEAFDGTVLLVTHDRWVVDRLATEIWPLENARLRVFDGGYHAYQARQASQPSSQTSQTGPLTAAARSAAATPAPSPGNGARDADAALSKNEQRRRQREAKELEARIDALEARLDQIAAEIQAASEAGDYDAIQSATDRHADAMSDRDRLYAQWVASADA